jgi:hypothetical protein
VRVRLAVAVDRTGTQTRNAHVEFAQFALRTALCRQVRLPGTRRRHRRRDERKRRNARAFGFQSRKNRRVAVHAFENDPLVRVVVDDPNRVDDAVTAVEVSPPATRLEEARGDPVHLVGPHRIVPAVPTVPLTAARPAERRPAAACDAYRVVATFGGEATDFSTDEPAAAGDEYPTHDPRTTPRIEGVVPAAIRSSARSPLGDSSASASASARGENAVRAQPTATRRVIPDSTVTAGGARTLHLRVAPPTAAAVPAFDARRCRRSVSRIETGGIRTVAPSTVRCLLSTVDRRHRSPGGRRGRCPLISIVEGRWAVADRRPAGANRPIGAERPATRARTAVSSGV